MAEIKKFCAPIMIFMRRVRLTKIAVMAMLTFSSASMLNAEGLPQNQPGTTFTLWQLPNQTPTPIMSYVIMTVHGQLIVIDGGTADDAPYLRRFIHDHGNKVTFWLITHPHLDHMNAFREIITKPEGVVIEAVWGSFNPPTWCEKYPDDDVDRQEYRKFMTAVQHAGYRIQELSLGQTFVLDGISLTILSVRNPEIIANAYNNSSVVFKVKDQKKSVLFLADLGHEGGEKLLKSKYAEQLSSDYVQMAHHGQNGVGKEFYMRCHHKYCLWPTPRWLWNNDNGKGMDSGTWKTLEVRKWMADLNVEKHYCMFNGLEEIK